MSDVEESKQKESNPDSNGTVGAQTKNQPTPIISFFPDIDKVPGKLGTYASFLMLLAAIIASIIALAYSFKVRQDTSSCPTGFEDSCYNIGVVLRISFGLVAIFIIQMLGTLIYTPFFDYLWLVKYALFAGTVVGFYFVPFEVFGDNGYAWFARIGGFLFLIFQKIILLDFALKWNDSWVEKSKDEEGYGNLYLVGLLLVSAVLFMGSYAVIGILYWQFGSTECPENIAVITVTLGLSIIATILQLTINEEYSLLSSAVITSYVTYICYATVTLNPESTCNPTLNSGYQTVQAAIGMTIMTVSLLYATSSSISQIKLSYEESNGDYNHPGVKSLFTSITFVFILISCYYAMVLTNWATFQTETTISNVRTGYASYWLETAAQWLTCLLYMWTLIAPKLFPDRDFS